MKQLLKTLILTVILCIGVAVSQEKQVKATTKEETFENNENGIITINYDNSKNEKMKIGVTKDGKSYYYDLKNGKNTIDIPLTMGNGKYKLKILRNIAGTKYSVISSTNVELELEDENVVFLQSNVIVDFELTDKAIEKATSLTKQCKNEEEIVKTIYDYVVTHFTYDSEKVKNLSSGYFPDIEIIYKNQKGICYDISAVIAAMMRSQGIEVKLVTGYTDYIPNVYHAWNSVYDSQKDTWYTVDGTYDIAMYQAKKKYSMKKDASAYKNIKYVY